MALPHEYRNRILDETEKWALRFFEAFNSIGTGSAVIDRIADRKDWNMPQTARIITDMKKYTQASAPDKGEADSDSGDYAD